MKDLLLDSVVLIWALEDRYQAPSLLKALRKEGTLYISALSVIEILRGRTESEEARTREFLYQFEVVPLDAEIARVAVTYLREYWPRGFCIDFISAAIAATALVRKFILVTYNPMHYPMPEVGIYPIASIERSGA